ncbi:MAG: aspartate dehydrogenase domain-containing protein [Polaromonas sp.]|uniref:aspartate dehydrogenase domain-containing protein n=1 Tax=Polaromonas sp. TaxID=1869339 RepID=UPI0040365D66
MTSTHEAPVRRFALIGCGRIGSAVLAAWQGGGLPGWELVSVLSRTAAPQAGALATTDAAQLFARRPDLIVECAGPAALAQHVEAALAVAPVWTVSAVALADAAVLSRVKEAARRSGHRLRILPGALAGLDGVAAAGVDPSGTLQLDIDLLPGEGERAQVFSGSVREAAARYPDHVNVAVAAALAGPGPDAAQIRVHHPGPGPRFTLAFHSESMFGSLAVQVRPLVAPGVHPVAASIVAALRQELRPVWVG